MSALYIGTSGWHYPHWKGTFYPDDVPTRQWLAYYAERLHTAEINNSFYRLPSRETFAAWRDTVPPGFVFAVKASRFLTHMKKLNEPEEPLERLYDRIEPLGDKLGPILYQLPPRWRFNRERLACFLARLSPGHRNVFEFRDPSWLNDEAYDLLARHNAGFCIYELAGLTTAPVVTADFVYVRLHGPGGKYQGSYPAEALHGWLDAVGRWLAEGRDVYCYFDNDEAGFAAHNALAMQAMARDRSMPLR